MESDLVFMDAGSALMKIFENKLLARAAINFPSRAGITMCLAFSSPSLFSTLPGYFLRCHVAAGGKLGATTSRCTFIMRGTSQKVVPTPMTNPGSPRIQSTLPGGVFWHPA